MEIIIWTIAFLILGYLSGSVNYAIIITRLVSGKDIRTIGNQNPGASNVGRSVGTFWGILVGLVDALKGVIPVLVAMLTVFQDRTPLQFFILYCIGTAAVIGHSRPVWYGFKGGGGIATMQGISLFFIPIEYLFSMLLGGVLVIIGVKDKVKFRFTRVVPILFTTFSPFVALATTLWLDIPLFAHIGIGGHNWGMVAGAFVISLSILALNPRTLKQSTTEYRATLDQENTEEEKSGE
jgi:acyl phosphate:glycerol-3-phosphate acyltransferase